MSDTIKLNEVLGAEARYVAEADAGALESLPSAAWPALVSALAKMNGGGTPGIDCGVVKTHETLSDFDASRSGHWTDKGRRSEHSFDGREALWFERIQMRRGQPRQDLMVVDCGDCRVVLVMGG